jgi:hypothetical protein
MAFDDSFLLTELSPAEVMFLTDNEKALRLIIEELIRHDPCIAEIVVVRGDIKSYGIDYERTV